MEVLNGNGGPIVHDQIEAPQIRSEKQKPLENLTTKDNTSAN